MIKRIYKTWIKKGSRHKHYDIGIFKKIPRRRCCFVYHAVVAMLNRLVSKEGENWDYRTRDAKYSISAAPIGIATSIQLCGPDGHKWAYATNPVSRIAVPMASDPMILGDNMFASFLISHTRCMAKKPAIIIL